MASRSRRWPRPAGPADRRLGRPAGGTGGPRPRSEFPVADLLYTLLLVGVFAVLVLCLRGLERL
ncbi:hypothetical protein GCM10023403_17640 [Pseudonocardia benzenivorans]|nr:hypothetical protein PSD17_21740 [Pseudonocardia sp. D17]